jgi:hypothetical protein
MYLDEAFKIFEDNNLNIPQDQYFVFSNRDNQFSNKVFEKALKIPLHAPESLKGLDEFSKLHPNEKSYVQLKLFYANKKDHVINALDKVIKYSDEKIQDLMNLLKLNTKNPKN